MEFFYGLKAIIFFKKWHKNSEKRMFLGHILDVFGVKMA